ncbi:helix-turn-helix transcriptional regulator [Mariprofundus ferrooxydans]|nr:helix-turn-helix transcriptional regulator [Mariprofundus ferrooxydans]
MIRIRLTQMLDDKGFSEKRKIPLKEVAKKTRLSQPTLSRISNIPGYNTNTDTINALCKYFECSPGKLLEFYPDEPG